MNLKELNIKGFRCYKDFGPIIIQNLSLLVGSNDAGKSSIVDALEILLSKRAPLADEFHETTKGQKSDSVEILGVFDATNSGMDDFFLDGEGNLRVKKIFFESGTQIYVYGRRFKDPDLQNFDTIGREKQISVLKNLGISPLGRMPDRALQLAELAKTGKVEMYYDWRPVIWNDIVSYLPSFEKVASVDYQDPSLMIQRTLQDAVSMAILVEEGDDKERALIPPLREAEQRIRKSLDTSVGLMKDSLRKYLPDITDIGVEPSIDFSRSVSSTPLQIDTGSGSRYATQFGEGTKKKLWMGILLWQTSQAKASSKNIIRIYDEPDLNLDYHSSTKWFGQILEDSRRLENVQTIVCTHDIAIINRAPASSIIRIVVAGASRKHEQLGVEYDDAETRDFLTETGRSVGITNAALMYEKSFLVVEGITEESALPILYRRIYGNSMAEDGIIIVQLGGASNWKPIMQVLHKHKRDITAMFLDSDVQNPGSKLKINSNSLLAIGFDANYQQESTILIGENEYEDSFPNEAYVQAFNSVEEWSKADGEWTEEDFQAIREGQEKFSKVLEDILWEQAEVSVGKGDIGRKVAETCSLENHVPVPIREVFYLLRQKSGNGGL